MKIVLDITVLNFMKGMFNIIIHVDIDISKFNYIAASISSNGKLLIDSFKLSNNYDGFYLLLFNLLPLDQSSSIIGLEYPAHYSNNLVHFLTNKDFKVCSQPYQDFVYAQNNIRKTKADKVNTIVIA